MRKNPLAAIVFVLTILLASAALVASAILLVDYVRPAPVFCAPGGGCGSVRRTVFAYPLGIPLPAIGLSGIFALAIAALVPGALARRIHVGLAAVGGLGALFFFGVQARMGVLCPYCAVVDGSLIVLFGLAVLRIVKGWDPPAGRVAPGVSSLALVLATVIPAGVGFAQKPPPVASSGVTIPDPTPEAIANEMKVTGKGKVTVVDFADFECPYCRMTHTALAPLLAARKDKVRVARKHVPLRMHPHALDAAKAGCCAEALGKGDEMADALFTTDPKALTAEGCEKLATEHGIDLERFRACVKDPATEARIKRDGEAFQSSGGHGLPTIWVNGTRIGGAQDADTFASVLDDAIRRL